MYLEGSIGKTGVLAMRPFLHMTRKDPWMIYVVDYRALIAAKLNPPA